MQHPDSWKFLSHIHNFHILCVVYIDDVLVYFVFYVLIISFMFALFFTLLKVVSIVPFHLILLTHSLLFSNFSMIGFGFLFPHCSFMFVFILVGVILPFYYLICEFIAFFLSFSFVLFFDINLHFSYFRWLQIFYCVLKLL